MHKLKVLTILMILVMSLSLPGNVSARPLAVHSPSLGTADSFAVLAGTAITLVPSAAITGDVGLSPAAGSNYTGITAAQVTGTIYAVDASGPAGSVSNPGLLTIAKNDLITAYDGLAETDNATCTIDWSGTGPIDLTTKSPLPPGIYCADAFILTGNLTLSGSDVYIFRSASTINTSTGSSVTGDNACNVWWRAESSAILETTTSFIGNILALTSISLRTGATLNGRALARNGAVTMDSNTISVAICAAAPTATPIPIRTRTATKVPVTERTATAAAAKKTAAADTKTAVALLPPAEQTAVKQTAVKQTAAAKPTAEQATETPVVPGLPGAGGGAPIRNEDFPWSLVMVGGGLSAIALVLGVRAFRRTHLPKQ